MSSNNDQLYVQRMNVIQQLRNLDADIGEGAISGEQRHQIDKHNAAINDLDTQIQRNIRNAEASAATGRLNDLVGGYGAPAKDSRSAAIAELLGVGTKGETRGFDVANGRVLESRDLLTTTSGASIEVDFISELQSVLTTGSPIFDAAKKINVDHTRSLQYPNISAAGSAAFLAEGGTIAESDPTLSTIVFDSYKVGMAMQISSESEHELSAVLDIVALDMTRSLGVAIDEQLVLGDGTTEPQGLAVGCSNTFTLGGVIAPTSSEIVQAFHNVAPAYRAAGRMVWAFEDSTVQALRLLQDGDGRSLWSPSMSDSQSDMLLGSPVIASSNIAAAGANNILGYFYDADKFVVRTGPIRIERSSDYAFLSDVISFRALTSVDSVFMDAAAGTTLKCAAS
jgi:HK97 family phage major capsid protein